jgi:hypothetical protein
LFPLTVLTVLTVFSLLCEETNKPAARWTREGPMTARAIAPDVMLQSRGNIVSTVSTVSNGRKLMTR